MNKVTFPTTATATISRRTLNGAINEARNFVNKIKSAYTQKQITTWADIETRFGFPLNDFTPEAKLCSIGSSVILNFKLEAYVSDTEKRLQRAAQQNVQRAERLRITHHDECRAFVNNPEIKLYPEQDPAFKSIFSKLFGSSAYKRAVLCPGGTGSGKTAIGAAIIDEAISKALIKAKNFPIDLPYPIIWVTVRNAVEQTRRFLESKAGLAEHLDRKIHVVAYSELTSGKGIGKFVKITTTTDLFTGNAVEQIEWLPTACCILLIADECQKIMRVLDTKVGKAFRALDTLARSFDNFIGTRFLFMSATPFEKVNDARAFVCVADVEYAGMKITWDNFNQSFANIISPDPTQPVAEANKRLFNALSDNIVEIPYYAWPHKAINSVRYFGFLNAEDKDRYAAAYDRYVDRCQKMGRDVPSNMFYIPLLMFRKEVEPIRAIQIAECMHEDVTTRNKSAIMGTAFTGTIIKSVFHLMDKHGCTRDDIAIFWGGRANIQPERILTEADIYNILASTMADGGILEHTTKKLIERNLAWKEDRILFGDTSADEQDSRYQRLKDLKLIGIQNLNRRQEEIDKFMSGRAKFAFFTFQSGGTGLSLEHATDFTLSRVGYYSPIYNGKEFVQGLGRLPRRNSISDTEQYICLMSGTVEATHVAPRLDLKLSAIGEFSTRKTDLADILTRAEMLRRHDDLVAGISDGTIRDLNQVIIDAHTNEATQLHADHDDSDDDDDDDN